MTSPDGETIRGGHYKLEKGFDRGHYSRGYIIQGRTLIKEIRYISSHRVFFELTRNPLPTTGSKHLPCFD